MIGQEALVRVFDKMHEEGMPPLVMLVGESGMGKKTFIKEFARRTNMQCIMVGKTIKELKQIVIEARKMSGDVLYVIPDVAALHHQSIAVLLKLTEEPPSGSHFVMLAQYEEQVPATILSRARVERMNPYSAKELRAIGMDYYKGEKKVDLAVELVQTPGDIKKALETDLSRLDAYVEKVIQRLEEVQPANAFKTSTELAFTDKDTGWDVLMFMRMLRLAYTRKMLDDRGKDITTWKKRITITSRTIQRLERSTVSRRMIYDEWVLKIRRVKK